MISVLIRAEHGVEALAVTLRALIPAAVDGLVGDAIVLAPEPDPVLEAVAEEVGAVFVVASVDSWRQGARVAKRDWILCLDEGDMPSEGWIYAIERFFAASPSEGSFGRFDRRRPTLIDAVKEKIRHFLELSREKWPPARVKKKGRTNDGAGFARKEPDLGPKHVQAGDLVHRTVLLGGRASARPIRLAAVIERDPVLV